MSKTHFSKPDTPETPVTKKAQTISDKKKNNKLGNKSLTERNIMKFFGESYYM
jgi:hypothetical protein